MLCVFWQFFGKKYLKKEYCSLTVCPGHIRTKNISAKVKSYRTRKISNPQKLIFCVVLEKNIVLQVFQESFLKIFKQIKIENQLKS